VRYLVVGAHALAIAGRPRATQDLDIFVEPGPETLHVSVMRCAPSAFPALADEASRFAEPDGMATLGSPPLQIDVMTSTTGLTLDEAWA
jgi:hypothetical protein